MYKKIFSILTFLFLFNICSSQEHAWVYFKDKPDEAAFLASPLSMLTQKALDRRTKQNITLDNKDIPISNTYISSVKNAIGIEVKSKSKWLNALHIIGSETDINALADLSFVDYIEFAANNLNASSKSINVIQDKFEVKIDFNYGSSANQIEILNGDFLHQQNFTGNGMTIAVMDGGFLGVNTFTAFQRIRDNNQILGGYDFVNRSTNFYSGISHGTSVLSTMAAFVDGQLVGTAPDANYYLFITEDGSQETPLEESLWVEAAEKADSLGVDVINTSLGYSTFDDSRYNYTYADMNGTTTFITRGADIAFSRGMIVVNSAGNSGNNPWHYITAPADGFNVLAIGAVDGNENITGFSSFGPTSDSRIKPDANAKGGGTTLINGSGNVSTGNGTSFSSPVICGIIACLWQAYPYKTNIEIIQIIKESGHLYSNPRDQEGYGIPDFETVFNTLSGNNIFADSFKLYPNPFQNTIRFQFINNFDNLQVTIFDLLGKRLLAKKVTQNNPLINVNNLSQGIYILRVNQNKKSKSFKVIKK
ncbi:MAG: S8 family serine peptidase [Flavobacteriaceae bacterium]|nr:S8 family serine peptidase [Flavobacteriaceae bacterium]